MKENRGTRACPSCGQPGTVVKRVTLNSLLKAEALGRLGSEAYRFCGSPDCEVVYFAEEGERVFRKSDLKVRVGIKESEPPRYVCYCFEHTIEEIEDDVCRTGDTGVPDDIRTRMKEACWCETKSPQGSCCLGTVAKYVKAAKEKARAEGRTAGEASAAEQTVVLVIEGMTCEACARKIERELRAVSGVRGVRFDYRGQQATVAIAREARAEESDRLLSAVEKAGCHARVVTASALVARTTDP